MKHSIRINGEVKEYESTTELSESERKWCIAYYVEYMKARMAGYSKNSPKRNHYSESRVNFLGDKIKCI